MGKRKDSFKRDNRGMTLVELMCSIAIFACITAVIGSVLVVTAKTYRGGTAEASLQQEAQLAVNVIEGLIIDAGESVNYCYVDASDVRQDINSNSDIPTGDENCDRILEITNSSSMNNKIDIIYEVSAQRLMYQKTEAGALGTAYLLAENITDFDADISNYDATHNIVLNIGMEKDSRKFEAEYNVTSRNDDVKANPYSPTPSVDLGIGITELVLEPNQVYELPVTVTATMGLSTDFTCTLYKEPTSTSTAVANCADGKITITIGTEERGNSMNCMYLAVFSAATKADGTPMQHKTIPICIRRVEGLTVDMTQDDPTIGKYAAGTEYTVMSNITGTPFLGPRVNELDYECAYTVDWEYDFKIGGTATSPSTYFSFAEHDATNSTPAYVNVTLLTEMPANSKLTVKGKAMHPAGENKANAWYATIEDTDSLIRPGSPPVFHPDPSTLLRGDDFMVFDTASLTLNQPQNCEYRIFWRYRIDNEDGTYGDWTSYHRTVEGGLEQKINANESYCLLPNKAYEIEMIQGAYEGTKLKWPADPWLLDSTDGYVTGFEGFTADWDVADETTLASYAIRFKVGATILRYSEDEAGTSPVDSVGTETSPYVLSGSKNWYFVTPWLHKEKVSTYVKYVVEYRANMTDPWTAYGDISSWASKSNKGFTFSNVNNATDGYYRIGIYLENYPLKVITGDVLNPVVSSGLPATVNVPLYDFSTGQGVMYFKVE